MAVSNVVRAAPALRPVAEVETSPSASVVMLSDPWGDVAEAIRALRARIQSEHLQVGRRALAICAPTPEVGCSFVSVNLAVALSQVGVKTLLVDANLRDPSVQTYFGTKDVGGGVRACLADSQALIDDHVRRNVQPNLDVLFAGENAFGSHELLASAQFGEFMNDCLRDYDITIVDTPPARSSADCLIVANAVGFALIVARKDRSYLSDIRTLAGQIRGERAQVIGTVLNSY